jgi:hypothetical protein
MSSPVTELPTRRKFIDTFIADDLSVDPTVQRTIDTNWVNARKKSFAPNALHVLTVSLRTNGLKHIIDGQHRHALAQAVGHHEPLTCEVYVGLSLADEAYLFRLLNDRRKVTPIDNFRIRVIEGEPVATKLTEVLTRYGWVVQPNKAKHSFQAVSALEKIYTGWGPQKVENLGVVEAVISIISAAWEDNPDGVRGEIITGLGMVLMRHGPKVNISRLVAQMKAVPGGPAALSRRSKALREMSGGMKIGDAVATNFINMSNANLSKTSKNRLPSWMQEEDEDMFDELEDE